MAAQRLGKRVLSKLQSPSRARGPGGSPGGLQKRHARVTVKYDRRELQRRLDVEKWIDGRLEELYRGRVSGEGTRAKARRGALAPADPGSGPLTPSGSLVACARLGPTGERTAGDQAFSGLAGPCSWTRTHTWVSRDARKHLGKAGG